MQPHFSNEHRNRNTSSARGRIMLDAFIVLVWMGILLGAAQLWL